MSRLVKKILVDRPQQAIFARRNRLLAFLPCEAVGDFEKVAAVLQPIFQRVGYALPIHVRTLLNPETLKPVNINYKGPIKEVVLGLALYSGVARKGATAEEVDQFVAMVTELADSLTDLIMPKSWFGRKSSTGNIARPLMPRLEPNREQALATAARLQQYINALPAFQRHVTVSVAGAHISEDELNDFAEFVEIGQRVRPNAWADRELGSWMSYDKEVLTLALLSIPATWKPEQLFDEILEIGRRFQIEYGGILTCDEGLSRQVILGWRNVLAPIGFQPGDEEARDIFPLPPME
jgi:hypothetical protein